MSLLNPVTLLVACVALGASAHPDDEPQEWPQFRGPGATGVADGYPLRTSWSAATPAISQGVIYFRTTESRVAIK